MSEPFLDPSLDIAARVDDLVGRMTLEEKIGQVGNVSPAIDRLGIPEYDWWNECLHGVGRAGRATVFPQAIGMAATWNVDLIFRIATAISDEARAKYHDAQRRGNRGRYMGLTYWSPNINILRDPRWGRAQETYGEDPYLTARLGVAFIKGLQGDDPKYLKLVATAKHFAAHSGPEGGRSAFDAHVTAKDLWETYLPAFEAAVKEAGSWSIMGAYNRLNGEPCCASPTLLGEILRDQWGFEGFVVSDCGAIENIYSYHKIAGSMAEAAALGIKEGCDLCCGSAYSALRDAVAQGLVTEAEIDVCVKRLFTGRMKLGMFDPDECVPFSTIPVDVVDSPEHRALARKSAVESIVLLKNDGVLPLSKDWPFLFVTGPNADALDVLLGNYNGFAGSMVTIIEGIIGKVTAGSRVGFSPGCALNGPATNHFGPVAWDAKEADLIVACVGLSPKLEGEEGDAAESDGSGDRLSVGLPASQLSLLRFLDGLGKPLVLIVTGGSPMLLPGDLQNVRAILLAWYPGAEGGNAVADVLFGDANPAGRLPVSFPGPDTEIPPMTHYSMSGPTYRVAESPYLYPFGYGLSYTTFGYGEVEVTGTEPCRVSVAVSNLGKSDGDEVVQMYVRDLAASTRVPVHQLAGFQRVHLAAGETKHVTIDLPESALSVVLDDGKRVLESGDFEVYVGGGQPFPEDVASGRVRKATLHVAG